MHLFWYALNIIRNVSFYLKKKNNFNDIINIHLHVRPLSILNLIIYMITRPTLTITYSFPDTVCAC